MSLPTDQRQIHRMFEIALILKALHSLLEILGGLLLASVGTGTLLRIAKLVTRGELIEDPNDLIANYILHAAQNFSLSAKAAAVFFLLSHGMVKLVLVLSVMKGFSWAYPAFMLALALLIGIQSYQLWHHVSLLLAVVTIFDLIVLALTWHEYQMVRTSQSGTRKLR
jgi:uncharacterized membrane protein